MITIYTIWKLYWKVPAYTHYWCLCGACYLAWKTLADMLVVFLGGVDDT